MKILIYSYYIHFRGEHSEQKKKIKENWPDEAKSIPLEFGNKSKIIQKVIMLQFAKAK